MTLVSTLGQALDQIERIKQQQSLLGTLQLQVATGKKSQTFEGLGSDTILSERSRAEFNKSVIFSLHCAYPLLKHFNLIDFSVSSNKPIFSMLPPIDFLSLCVNSIISFSIYLILIKAKLF